MKQEVCEGQQCFWPERTDDKCKANNKEEPLKEREKMIALNKIRLDGDTQSRESLSGDVVDEYAELIANGVDFPRCEVLFDGTDYWVIDGFHRINAYLKLSKEQIDCVVREGTREDAEWLALAANKTHGLRRSNKDKEKAVRKALSRPNWRSKCNAVIAKHVGVSAPTVAKYRKETEPTQRSFESEVRTDRNGRKIDVSAIGRTKANGENGDASVMESTDSAIECEQETLDSVAPTDSSLADERSLEPAKCQAEEASCSAQHHLAETSKQIAGVLKSLNKLSELLPDDRCSEAIRTCNEMERLLRSLQAEVEQASTTNGESPSED